MDKEPPPGVSEELVSRITVVSNTLNQKNNQKHAVALPLITVTV